MAALGFSLLAACSLASARHAKPATTPINQEKHPLKPPDRLPADIEPIAYSLDLLLDAQTRIVGKMVIDLRLQRAVDDLRLHAQALQMDRVTVQPAGEAPRLATVVEESAEGLIRLATTDSLPAGPLRLEFNYSMDLTEQRDGIFKAMHNGQAYLFSVFAPASARRAFPCLDEPGLKAPFALRLHVPTGQMALSNMPERSRRPSVLYPGHDEVAFNPTPPLPPYLVTVATGPLDVIALPPLHPTALRPNALPLRAIGVRGSGLQMMPFLQRAAGLVVALETYFDRPFPFPKLDLVAVPDFVARGMENAGAITFADWIMQVDPQTASRAEIRESDEVLAHEITHQWFGDSVTMAWWDDLWLNEGFANWAATHIVQQTAPQLGSELAAAQDSQTAMQADSLDAARAIRQPAHTLADIINAFDAITYLKGAAVLRMLEDFIGPDAMRAGIHRHLAAHAFGTASSADLFSQLGKATAEPLGEIFAPFLEQPGLPVITARVQCSDQTAVLHLEQAPYRALGSALTTVGSKLWPVPVRWRYADAQGQQCSGQLVLRGSRAQVTLPSCPLWLMPNAGGTGYYRFVVNSTMRQRLLEAPLSAREQLAVADSLGANLADGSAALVETLADFGRLARHGGPAAVSAAADFFDRTAGRLSGVSRRAVYAQLRRLLGPTLRHLGLGTLELDAEAGLLEMRRRLAQALARADDRPTRLALAASGRRLLDQPLGQLAGSEAIPCELTDLSLALAVDEGLVGVEELLRHLGGPAGSLCRRTLLQALGQVGSLSAAAAARTALLEGHGSGSEILLLLRQQIQQPSLRLTTWEWFKTHYAELQAKLPAFRQSTLPTVGEGFCSAAEAADLQHFFAPKLAALPGAARPLAQTLEKIRHCMALPTL
jgi:alanyl aminopeptidase